MAAFNGFSIELVNFFQNLNNNNSKQWWKKKPRSCFFHPQSLTIAFHIFTICWGYTVD
jgi:uncharacterized protein (DUF2461 family)